MIERLVSSIHATPHRMVMAFAGAGAQALAWLHAVGGSSRTVLEATDIYSNESMRDYIGYLPEQSTSLETAKAMAQRSYEKAVIYAEREAAGSERNPVFGIGSTATIATDRPKRGDHRVAIAVTDGLGTVTYHLTLEKLGRDRHGEEELVSLLVLRAIADACGVLSVPELPLMGDEVVDVHHHPSQLIEAVQTGAQGAVVVNRIGLLEPVHVQDSFAGAILSGSFNPAHAGHLRFADAVTRTTGLPTWFELPVVNAEKAPIQLIELRFRALQFPGISPVLLTQTPLFSQKAELFPGAVFAVGFDTAVRIVDPRFYGNDPEEMLRALEQIRQFGSRFIVAGRRDKERYRVGSEIIVPSGFEQLFQFLPEQEFREDISSSEIRQRWANITRQRVRFHE